MLTCAVALASVLGAAPSLASCLSLPSADLRALEQREDSDPESAVSEAANRLAALTKGRDPMLEAELFAIIAAARGAQGRVDEAHNAIASSRALLNALPPSPDKRRVTDHLAMSYVLGVETRGDLLTGVNAMNAILAREPVRSIGYVCALASRADLRAELLELDLAAADGIEAYATAEREGYVEARIQAAASLATIYRRSALFDDAERMIDEVIRYEQDERRPSQLAAAMYSRGQIQLGAGHFHEARSTFETSRGIAAGTGDLFGAAFTDIALCPALIGEREFDTADRVCTQHLPEFTAAKRDDLVTLLLGYRARLDLERGKPNEALAKLNEILGPRASDVLPSIEPDLYHDRSRAEGALGHFTEAYRDLLYSLELQHRLDVTQRSRAAAVLTAAVEVQNLLSGRRALTRRLWTISALAIVAMISLIAYALWIRGRQERNLRREQMALRTASSSTPDTLMLIDAKQVIRFANRPLFPGGRVPATGEPLREAVSAVTWQSLEPALTEVFEHLRSGSLSTSLIDAAGAIRQLEVRCEPVLEGSVLLGATLRCIDVTELRSLEREILDTSTRERQRLSSDLHDGLGQELTGISLLLQNLATQMERGMPDTRLLVNEILGHVNRTIKTTRDIAHGLSPLQVEQGSLSRAIGRLAVEAGRRLHLEVAAHSEPIDVALPEETADHLYRIVFEAITNAARHSACSRIDIFLQLRQGEIHLSVEDNGSGLPPNGIETTGFGLKTMAYRARLLGGTFALEPRADGGATLKVRVPLAMSVPVGP
jgi:signal transduction histidine kinase